MCGGDYRALNLVCGGLTRFDITALTMTDVPKKNKKGKRVA